MAYTDASIETYIREEFSGEIKRKRDLVLEFIIRHPGATIVEIKRRLKMPHQSATASVSNLTFEGKIYVADKIELQAGTYSRYKYEPNKQRQRDRMIEQRQIVVDQIVKRIRRDFDDYRDYIIRKLQEQKFTPGPVKHGETPRAVPGMKLDPQDPIRRDPGKFGNDGQGSLF